MVGFKEEHPIFTHFGVLRMGLERTASLSGRWAKRLMEPISVSSSKSPSWRLVGLSLGRVKRRGESIPVKRCPSPKCTKHSNISFASARAGSPCPYSKIWDKRHHVLGGWICRASTSKQKLISLASKKLLPPFRLQGDAKAPLRLRFNSIRQEGHWFRKGFTGESPLGWAVVNLVLWELLGANRFGITWSNTRSRGLEPLRAWRGISFWPRFGVTPLRGLGKKRRSLRSNPPRVGS